MKFLYKILSLAPAVLLGACAQERAPSFMILGSYFPAWLVGAALSIPVTLLLRWGLVRAGIDDALPMRLLVYVCIALVFTIAFAFAYSPR